MIAVKRKSVVRPRSQRALEHFFPVARVDDFESGAATRFGAMFKIHFAQRAEVIAGHRLLWPHWQVSGLINMEGWVPAHGCASGRELNRRWPDLVIRILYGNILLVGDGNC